MLLIVRILKNVVKLAYNPYSQCFNFIHPVKYPIKYFAFAKENQRFYLTG